MRAMIEQMYGILTKWFNMSEMINHVLPCHT